ncbi:hypothetical protein AB1N83_006887 [Pleurotus pulmonarius]
MYSPFDNNIHLVSSESNRTRPRLISVLLVDQLGEPGYFAHSGLLRHFFLDLMTVGATILRLIPCPYRSLCDGNPMDLEGKVEVHFSLP